MTKKIVVSNTDIGVSAGFALLFLVLGICGAVYAPQIPAKVISLAIGVVGLVSIPVWLIVRGAEIVPDFTTRHVMHVAVGDLNKPTRALVESWTDELVKKWCHAVWTDSAGKVRTLAPTEVYNLLRGMKVFFMDSATFNVNGRELHGYSQGSDAVIGYSAGNPEWVYQLFLHEVSHPILYKLGETREEEHHRIFKAVKV